MKRLNLTPFALILAASANVMAAQDAKSLLIDAGPCLGFQTAAEKLACFEKQVKAAQTPAGTYSETAPEVSTSIRNPVSGIGEQPHPAASVGVAAAENFGLKENAEIKKARDAQNELTSTIAGIKEIMPNKYRITLQNGQVWHQMHSQRYALSVGQEVRIYPNPWGSAYRLAVKKLGGFIDVERTN